MKIISNKNESKRIFQSPFLEWFTHVHWSVPLFIYIPIIIYFLWKNILEISISFPQMNMLVLLGILTWTLVEYLMHRFLFHYQFKSDLGKRLHFLSHGVHHDHPQDSSRLVMPPVISIPIALFFYGICRLIMNEGNGEIFFSGFVLGYLIYDMIHYATHHATLKGKVICFLKYNHMRHHFNDENSGFGVSSPLWDYVFRTHRRLTQQKPK